MSYYIDNIYAPYTESEDQDMWIATISFKRGENDGDMISHEDCTEIRADSERLVRRMAEIHVQAQNDALEEFKALRELDMEDEKNIPPELQYRRDNFEVKLEVVPQWRRSFKDWEEYALTVTTNGFQYSGFTLLKEEIPLVIDKLKEVV